MDGYWLIVIDRETGSARTVRDLGGFPFTETEKPQRIADSFAGNPAILTMVVGAR